MLTKLMPIHLVMVSMLSRDIKMRMQSELHFLTHLTVWYIPTYMASKIYFLESPGTKRRFSDQYDLCCCVYWGAYGQTSWHVVLFMVHFELQKIDRVLGFVYKSCHPLVPSLSIFIGSWLNSITHFFKMDGCSKGHCNVPEMNGNSPIQFESS